MAWRTWVIDWPARLTTFAWLAAAAWFAVLSAVTVWLLVVMLVLWFGFGIRWGW